MKKLFTFLLVLTLYLPATAGQNSYLSEKDAQRAVNYIRKNKINRVILWCGCCTDEPKKMVSVTKIFSRYTGADGYYEVVVEGYTSAESISKVVDLSFVWVPSENMAKDLATALQLESTPCAVPFEFDPVINSSVTK